VAGVLYSIKCFVMKTRPRQHVLLKVVSKASLLFRTYARCSEIRSGEVLLFSDHDLSNFHPPRCPEPFIMAKSTISAPLALLQGTWTGDRCLSGRAFEHQDIEDISMMARRALAPCAMYSLRPKKRLEAL